MTPRFSSHHLRVTFDFHEQLLCCGSFSSAARITNHRLYHILEILVFRIFR